MSSELERLLREARNALPGSSDEAAERARVRALAAAAGGRRRGRPALAVALAIVCALVLGVAIGASRTPTSAAAPGPRGVGFLPAAGWYVVQNGGLGTPDRPAIATAASVPIQPGDGASILPYATLQALPGDGVVLVASIVAQGSALSVGRSSPRSSGHALRLDSATGIQYGAQVRPERPLGQYQIHANVEGYAVDIHLYFGTPVPSADQRLEAQRQLDMLVLGPDPDRTAPAEEPTAATKTRSAQSTGFRAVRIFDRACNCYRLQFSGTISPARAGEYVSVLRQQCGTSFGTAVAGAQTQAGGFWEATTMFSPPPGRESATYWASWNDTRSASVRFRGRLFVSLDALGTGRFRATVQTAEAPQRLAGKTILLQRRTGSGWERVLSRRLLPDTSIPGAAFAMFSFTQKRTQLRALVPAASAKPCFLASPSDPIRS